MAMDRGAGAFSMAPEAALEVLRGFDGPVLLDLDETLYLRSSTEDFIDTARPALLACLLLKLLDLLRPWRLTGPETRDTWRVGLVLLLLPWTLPLWRRRVASLAGRFANAPLREAARAGRTVPTVVTLGFGPVVAPLVAALGLADAPIVAARAWNMADRRDGKLALALGALGPERLAKCLCITDSPKDLPVLEACARPVLTVWPQARFRPAFAGLYLPGRYLARVKRPESQYMRRSILQDDFMLWILASVWLAAFPASHVLGLLCLLASFWSVYEQGYVDNDRMGARFEADPRLPAAFGTAEVATPRLAPWIWAAALGGAGLLLLRWPAPPSAADAALWTATLAATFLLFGAFNRLDKATRVWLYPGLQLARCGAFAVLVPVVPAAPAVIGATVVEKWIPYLLYRLPGGEVARAWSLPLPLLRLSLVPPLVLLAASREGAGLLIQWPTLALVGFLAFKARRELRHATASASRIDRARRRARSGARAPEPVERLARVGAPSL